MIVCAYPWALRRRWSSAAFLPPCCSASAANCCAYGGSRSTLKRIPPASRIFCCAARAVCARCALARAVLLLPMLLSRNKCPCQIALKAIQSRLITAIPGYPGCGKWYIRRRPGIGNNSPRYRLAAAVRTNHHLADIVRAVILLALYQYSQHFAASLLANAKAIFVHSQRRHRRLQPRI